MDTIRSMPRQVLGRGLGALLNAQNQNTSPKDSAEPITTSDEKTPGSGMTVPEGNMKSPEFPTEGGVVLVPLDAIIPSPLQPRKEFTPDSLKELSDSIREKGILQPLVVRPSVEPGKLELIAGERRWRASRLAGLDEVPVIVKPNADQSALEWMMVENLQREDLNPLEEAKGYFELSQKFKLKQDEIARKVGKSRAAVANSMRLLKLPASVQDMLWRGDISVGHAKVLLGISGEEDVQKAAMRALKDRLSVRQLEELLQRWHKATAPGDPSPPPARESLPAEIQELEDLLRQKFATKVSIKYKDEKGSVEIRFFNNDDLDRIVQILKLKEN